MTEIVVALPFPISVNGAFKRHNGGRLSPSYKRWRDNALVMLLQQRPKPTPIKGRVSVLMELCPPTNILRDIDNLW
jgi:Holliday junction resolvase RusA-like endonuclease